MTRRHGVGVCILAIGLLGIVGGPLNAASAPQIKIHGSAQFVSFEGYATRIKLAVRCASSFSCYADSGVSPVGKVHISQRIGDTRRVFNLTPSCLQVSSVGPPHTNLATMSGFAVDGDGSPVGVVTIVLADFGEGRHPATTNPDLDRADVALLDPGASPFCPNAFRHGSDGNEITKGNLSIEE